jgi:hypothetical protein
MSVIRPGMQKYAPHNRMSLFLMLVSVLRKFAARPGVPIFSLCAIRVGAGSTGSGSIRVSAVETHNNGQQSHITIRAKMTLNFPVRPYEPKYVLGVSET